MHRARIETFFDPATCTASHLVSCPVTRAAAVIDSVLDYDPKSGRTSTEGADRLLAHVAQQGLRVDWHLETHAHADGDTLFMPDDGTARCDFPGGDARTLYRSVRKVLSLPERTRLHLCHDYLPGGREARWETTVAAQRATNVHVRDGIDEDTFVAMRSARDQTLAMPTLLLPSVQVNVRAGHLLPAEDNGVSCQKIPVNAL